MDNVIYLHVYYYMYMYLKMFFFFFFYNQYLQTRILPKANLFLLVCFIALIRKVRNYIECCFSGLKCLLSTLTYNFSHLFLDENMICQ